MLPKYCNCLIDSIKRMFKWAVAQELLPVSRSTRPWRTVARPAQWASRGHVRRSRSSRSTDEVVDATLPYLPAVVADMVRLHRLTGCRPAEVCILRPCDVDTSEAVWSYRPESHKTEHHGRDRVIFIGPKGQDVLRPYLLRDKTAYCFVPAESERKRNAMRRENRQSPMTPSQAATPTETTPEARAR